MTQPFIANIPRQLTIDGKPHVVIDEMQNYHYRALVLPIGGGNPRWLSNDEVRKILA